MKWKTNADAVTVLEVEMVIPLSSFYTTIVFLPRSWKIVTRALLLLLFLAIKTLKRKFSTTGNYLVTIKNINNMLRVLVFWYYKLYKFHVSLSKQTDCIRCLYFILQRVILMFSIKIMSIRLFRTAVSEDRQTLSRSVHLICSLKKEINKMVKKKLHVCIEHYKQ